MSNRLLESGDELLIETGEYRLLEELVITTVGRIARWREPSPESWRAPRVASWRDPSPQIGEA